MKPLHKKLKKFLALYDEIQMKVSKYESDLEQNMNNSLDDFVSKVKSSRLDNKIDVELQIANEKLAIEDLKPELKDGIEKYKNMISYQPVYQEKIRVDFETLNKNFNDRLKECHNFYDLASFSTIFSFGQKELISQNSSSEKAVTKAKKSLIKIIKEHAVLEEGNQNTADNEPELFTYTPNEKDELDVKFAENYNKCDMARKFQVRKIKFDQAKQETYVEDEPEDQMIDLEADEIPKDEVRSYCMDG